MKQLTKFNTLLNNFYNEETTATINGKPMEVKDDGKGNIEIKGEIPVTTEQAENNTPEPESVQNKPVQQSADLHDLLIDMLQEELEGLLIHATETSKSAKNYATYSSEKDKCNVMYNYGFAECQKNIIKLVLKKLNQL